MEGDEKAIYTNVIRFSQVVLKMARKKTSGEEAANLQTNGDRARWKLSDCMRCIRRLVHISRVHNGQIRKGIRVSFRENGKPMPYLASDDARWDIGLWDIVYS